jgi:hypothetical protein
MIETLSQLDLLVQIRELRQRRAAAQAEEARAALAMRVGALRVCEANLAKHTAQIDELAEWRTSSRVEMSCLPAVEARMSACAEARDQARKTRLELQHLRAEAANTCALMVGRHRAASRRLEGLRELRVETLQNSRMTQLIRLARSDVEDALDFKRGQGDFHG